MMLRVQITLYQQARYEMIDQQCTVAMLEAELAENCIQEPFHGRRNFFDFSNVTPYCRPTAPEKRPPNLAIQPPSHGTTPSTGIYLGLVKVKAETSI
jgi:hypothetical protein